MTDALSRGEKLRQVRLSRGWTVEHVATELKLSPKQVHALEENDLALLPKDIFVRGFVRNYARLLGRPLSDFEAIEEAPPATVLKPDLLDDPAPSMSIDAPMPFESVQASANRRWLLAALIVVVLGVLGALVRQEHLLALIAWWKPAPAPLAAAPNKAPEALTPPPPVPGNGEPEIAKEGALSSLKDSASSSDLLLEARADSWVEVRSDQGEVLFSGTVHEGERKVLQSANTLSVVIGNAPMVNLMWHGKAVDLNPFTRAVVARLTLDARTP